MKKIIWLLTFLISTAYAATPLWTFTPQTATSFKIVPGESRNVQYLVTNQSRKTHTLAYQVISGLVQNTGAGYCSNPFTLGSQQSCVLRLDVDGSQLQILGNITSGPVVCEQNGPGLQCYQPSAANQLNIQLFYTTLVVTPVTTSLTPLGLKASASGNPRQMTVTNTGTVSAVSLLLTKNNMPTGTLITNDLCTGITLEPGSSCTFNIQPGATVSSNCTTGIVPTPGTVIASATNSSQTVAAIAASTAYAVVLNYGCIYQQGYIYAIDDTQGCISGACIGGIGGKVAALKDQAPYSNRIIWSSNGSSATSFIPIYGISETSTVGTPNPNTGQITGQVACNGKTDGACDTNNIVTYYNANRAAGGAAPTPLTQYASGLCKASIGGYTDWYLPAICEMGPPSNGSGCALGTPNMVTNLNLLLTSCTDFSCLAGRYWSSTELSGNPTYSAWNQLFASGGGSNQNGSPKFNTLGVRCSRTLTP